MSDKTASHEQQPWMRPGHDGLSVNPFVSFDFETEVIEIRFGLCWHADVTGLVPDAVAGQFWAAFWLALQNDLQTQLATRLTQFLEELDFEDPRLERLYTEACAMLAARFEEWSNGARAAEKPPVDDPLVTAAS